MARQHKLMAQQMFKKRGCQNFKTEDGRGKRVKEIQREIRYRIKNFRK